MRCPTCPKKIAPLGCRENDQYARHTKWHAPHTIVRARGGRDVPLDLLLFLLLLICNIVLTKACGIIELVTYSMNYHVSASVSILVRLNRYLLNIVKWRCVIFTRVTSLRLARWVHFNLYTGIDVINRCCVLAVIFCIHLEAFWSTGCIGQSGIRCSSIFGRNCSENTASTFRIAVDGQRMSVIGRYNDQRFVGLFS